jgi:hypothetical protein
MTLGPPPEPCFRPSWLVGRDARDKSYSWFRLLRRIKHISLPAPTPCHVDSSHYFKGSPSSIFQFCSIRILSAPLRSLEMSSITTHLTRRVVALAHGAVAGDGQPMIKVSPVATAVLFFTCLVFFTLFAAVSFHSLRCSPIPVDAMFLLLP